ncbi:MAG: hypothetical protein K6A05_09375 [Lachnospiraceae bacterium]|nr:hypothetical protein [Lachnospiraceae bacterium]
MEHMTTLFDELADSLSKDQTQLDLVKQAHGAPIRLLQMSTARLWIFNDGFRLTIPTE